jgi:hypothetical protein
VLSIVVMGGLAAWPAAAQTPPAPPENLLEDPLAGGASIRPPPTSP